MTEQASCRISRVASLSSPLNCCRRHLLQVRNCLASWLFSTAPDEPLTLPQSAPPVARTMSPSNIRVFVQWKNATVFAGEDIECTITFKNVAVPAGRDRSPVRKQNGFAPGGERQRKLPPVHSSTRPTVSRNSSMVSQLPPQNLRGHRPALSLNTPSTVAAAGALGESSSPALPNAALGNNNNGKRHGRSLSIISLGTDVTNASNGRGTTPYPPRRGHGRSGSLQIVPGRPNSYPGMFNGLDVYS